MNEEKDDITIEEEVEAESSFKGNKDSKLQKLEAELEKSRAERQESRLTRKTTTTG